MILFAALLLALFSLQAADLPQPVVEKPELSSAAIQAKCALDIPIRVLLQKKEDLTQPSWVITAQDGFAVLVPEEKKRSYVYKTPELTIDTTAQGIAINGKKQSWKTIFIVPLDGLLKYANEDYFGILAVTIQDGVAYLVNHLDLEDYVTSIIPNESWPGWPDEINRALSICFRSYGFAKIQEHKKKAKKGITLPFDIQNSNVHLVYKGSRQYEKFKKIVDETKGLVLAYEGVPILAMFDICCGGIIPSRKAGLDFKKAPYLARNYACTHCKNYKYYEWELYYPRIQFEEKMREIVPHLKTLKGVQVSVTDRVGMVREIKVKDARRWYSIPASALKSQMKILKSMCFTMSLDGENIIFKGRGFGHLIGLCQRGAHRMVVDGSDYKKVLQFYYPGTTVMKLQKA